MRLSELASTLGCELKGDGQLEITGVAGMEHAGPTELTFLSNPKYAPQAEAYPRRGDSHIATGGGRVRGAS